MVSESFLVSMNTYRLSEVDGLLVLAVVLGALLVLAALLG